ncbi:hypothetical protein D2T29_12245 [Sinirhodobacter populi]|uniref:Resolvase/invertase-type recombinase catalytic domain-containing protein n=1 Tax=Paenirhodobacter populi TaxID=2306993 RepID=A0A443KCJ8_9RHOB|nr:hypothetical protein [Sinirhodobacter populi]RWR30436.1 hypothetical protein D2T29_12245 [Sinirhodobacter populi]
MIEHQRVYGYLLVAPGRPSEQEQYTAIQSFASNALSSSEVFIDRPIHWGTSSKLVTPERAKLLGTIRPLDVVVIANQLALGLTPKAALGFIDDIFDRAGTLVVLPDERPISLDRVDAMLEVIERARRRNNQARWRKRKAELR